MISMDTIFGCQKLEVSHPLAAIINNRVVTSGEDDIDHVTNYYDILQNIVAYTFSGAKELRVVFFQCDDEVWYHEYHVSWTQQRGTVGPIMSRTTRPKGMG
jgi:hypothetical protein